MTPVERSCKIPVSFKTAFLREAVEQLDSVLTRWDLYTNMVYTCASDPPFYYPEMQSDRNSENCYG